MRKIILFFIFILASITLIAQNDTIKKEKNRFSDFSKINEIDAKIIEKKVEIVESEEIEEEEEVDYSYLYVKKEEKLPLSYKLKAKQYLNPDAEDDHNFMTGEKPLDDDVLVVKRFEGKDVSNTKLSTGQDLGTVESNTKFVRIEYKDFGLVDGDRVKIFLNEEEIESNVHLDGLFYTIQIELTQKGYNRIDIQAINEGFVGPNTAEFVVYDDKGLVIAHKSWNLKTGSVATLGIVKKE